MGRIQTNTLQAQLPQEREQGLPLKVIWEEINVLPSIYYQTTKKYIVRPINFENG